MKVKKVVIEGFHNVARKEYTFDEINYLFGRNGAGKSTVLQAIQLGLLGYVPGTNKTKQGVFTHANNHMMAIKVVLEDNGNDISIQRIWTKSKASVSESVEINPDGYNIESLIKDIELPLFNFDEFSHMTANTLKDWFINYLPKQTFTTKWDDELKRAVKDLPESMIDSELIHDSVSAIGDFHLDGVEEIRQANTYFKNQLSFMKSELQRKTGTIQSLIHYDDYVAVHTEEELKSLISSTEQSVIQASLMKQSADRAEAIKREAEGLRGARELAEKKQAAYTEASENHKKLQDQKSEKQTQYATLLAEFKSYDNIIKSGGICTFTKKKCEEIASLRDTYLKKQEELSSKMDALTDEMTELDRQITVASCKARNIQSETFTLLNDARRYAQLCEELKKLPDTTTIPDVAELSRELEQYKDYYGKAVANRHYNELSSVVVKDKYRIENTIECLKLWVKLTDVNGLQASGDYNPFDLLAGNVDSVLQKLFNSDTVRCKFVAEGKANSFSFGVLRDDVYVPYSLLSSGEKCLFVLSMFIGLMEYNKSPLKLILIDDFLDHLDDENFKSIFNVLHDKTDIQFIFAGVKPVEDSDIHVINID